MDPLALVFGRRVRALRQARHWTQEDLAKAAGMDAKHIGAIERGAKTSSFSAVERIAEALSVPYYQLFLPEDRHSSAIEREINALLHDSRRIDLSNVEEFLRALRSAVKKLDRKQSL